MFYKSKQIMSKLLTCIIIFAKIAVVARRAGCSKKQQPDKAQTEMSVPYPFFYAKEN